MSDTKKLDPALLGAGLWVSHGPLSYDAKAGELISKEAGLAFAVRDGILIMLTEEARKLAD